jgi:hypothetical protein
MYNVMNFRKHLVDPWKGRKGGAICSLTADMHLVPCTVYEGRPLDRKGRADWLVRMARFLREGWTDILAWNNLWVNARNVTDLILLGLMDGRCVLLPSTIGSLKLWMTLGS